MNLQYELAQEILRLKGLAFELIHRSNWKPFCRRITPRTLCKTAVKKHLENLLEFPRTISIEVTNICNAKCWFCAQPFSKRKKGYIDFSLYRKIADEISQNTSNIKSIALFMDGEPTLHKKLVEFLKYAHELGIEKINLEYCEGGLLNFHSLFLPFNTHR